MTRSKRKGMLRDCGDILDRGSIAKLKHENIRDPENDKEWEAFNNEIVYLCGRYSNLYINKFFDLLYHINSFLWEKEADLRQGKLDGVLYEVGIRAIEIRKLNNLRVSVKNIINKLTDSGFQDIKRDHVSGE